MKKKPSRRRLAAIRYKLKDSKNLDKTVKDLIDKNPDLYDYVIDEYILRKEQRAGTRLAQNKHLPYETYYYHHASQEKIAQKIIDTSYFLIGGPFDHDNNDYTF